MAGIIRGLGTRRTGVVLAAAVGLALVQSTPAVAGDNSTCTYSGTIVRVRLLQDGSSGVLQRNAAGAIFYDSETSTPQPCGLATVFTTDRIVVKDASAGGSTGIVLDVSQGDFAAGPNEIPIKIDLGAGAVDTFAVVGGGGADNWTFGTARGNLQNDAAGEIDFLSQPDYGIAATGGGANRVCASGRRGTGRTSVMPWVMSGGGGDDKLCGGLRDDHLLGRGGIDRVSGKGGQDRARGGGGIDLVRGNAGNDVLGGGKAADDLRGGRGFDACKGGAGRDREASCER